MVIATTRTITIRAVIKNIYNIASLDVDSIAHLESFRALKLNLLESFRALKGGVDIRVCEAFCISIFSKNDKTFSFFGILGGMCASSRYKSFRA